jgi:hypothetical protein
MAGFSRSSWLMQCLLRHHMMQEPSITQAKIGDASELVHELF